MKRLRRRIIFALLGLVVLVTAGVYVYLMMIMEPESLYRDQLEAAKGRMDVAKESRDLEQQYQWAEEAAEAAEEALKLAQTTAEKMEAQQVKTEAEVFAQQIEEILVQREKERKRFVEFWLQRTRLRAEKMEEEKGKLLTGMGAVQQSIAEELKEAVVFVQADEVWREYQKVLNETKPDPASVLRFAHPRSSLDDVLARLNKERAKKELKPLGFHYFGNPETVIVDRLRRTVTFAFHDPKAVQAYQRLYEDPPTELKEEQLMRLRYVHRAVRELLELQIWDFAAAMRPPAKLEAVSGPTEISKAERERARRIIFEEIKELLESDQIDRILEQREIQWQRALPDRLRIPQQVNWTRVELEVTRRKALMHVLGYLRGVILRPLRRYPEPLDISQLYLEWLQKQEVIGRRRTHVDHFRWVKRLRPIDIFFNTPDGYIVWNLEFPPSPQHPAGHEADTAVLLKQEIDLAWLPLGLEIEGRYVRESRIRRAE